MRLSLRWRLLGLTLAVAMSAVAGAAWLANHQTRQDMLAEVNAERSKPQAIIGTLRLLAEQDQGWDGVRQRLGEVAEQHGLRIVLYSPSQGWWADSEQGAAQLRAEPIRVAPPDRPAGAAPGPPPFEPVDVYLGPTRIESGALLAGGLSERLVALIALVAGVTTAATVLIARRIARPVEALTRAARRMAEGHLDERVREERRDELGELSRTFNSMAASLAESDRLRRRMTDDVAHELRTPLSNIRGYLEAAQDGVAPLTAELVDSLYEDTLLLQALVDDLAELSQAESGQLRLELAPTDVDELVRSVVAAHQARAQAVDVTLQAEAAAHRPVPGDARRLRQVLNNLVENALRHTDAGGRVSVASRSTASGVEVRVADTGTGIPPEHLPHVFDRFYRADSSRTRATGGTGLGLAITRQLVAAHGGRVLVDSLVGRGTTFIVRLPAPADAARPAGPLPRHLPRHVPAPADFTYIDVG